MAISGVALTIDEMEEKKAKILEHLAEGYGRTFYGACQVALISTALGYRWRKESETFDDAVEEARRLGAESAKDVAESIVMKTMADGAEKEKAKMARWFLETKGKNRDYSKRSELTGAGGGPLGTLEEDAIREHLIGRRVSEPAAIGTREPSGGDDEAPA